MGQSSGSVFSSVVVPALAGCLRHVRCLIGSVEWLLLGIGWTESFQCTRQEVTGL